MARKNKTNPQARDTIPRMTPDFNAMIGIVKYNSVGFFFTDFVIPYAGMSMGGSGIQIGLLYSFMVLGSVISGLFVGYLTDRARKKTYLILIGAIGRGVSYLTMFIAVLVNSMEIMTLGTFLLGFLVEFFWNPFDALVSAKSNKDNRSFAFGKRHQAIGKGQLAGGIAGVIIFILASKLAPGVNALAFSPMLIYFAFNVAGGILFTRRVDEHLTYRDYMISIGYGKVVENVVDGKATLASSQVAINGQPAAKHPAVKRSFLFGFILLLAAYFLSAINGQMARPFIQVYLRHVVEADPVLVLLAYAPAGVTATFLSPMLGDFADRIKPYVGIALFTTLGALTTLVEINVFVLWIFSLLLIADTAFANASSLVMSNVFSRISIKNRGKVLGIASSINNAGGVIGPLIGGLLMDAFSPAMPFIVSIFIELSVLPLYLLALNRLKSHYAEIVSEHKIPLIDEHSGE
nr:MFS transporter [Candidatus Sigynarchaeota archaeon]